MPMRSSKTSLEIDLHIFKFFVNQTCNPEDINYFWKFQIFEITLMKNLFNSLSRAH